MKSRAHGKKTNKQLEDYLKSANPNDIFYLFAKMEKERRIEQGIWKDKKGAN